LCTSEIEAPTDRWKDWTAAISASGVYDVGAT
jgi:hypothetical protein